MQRVNKKLNKDGAFKWNDQCADRLRNDFRQEPDSSDTDILCRKVCDQADYESGKEDGFEEGYNAGLNASEKLGQEFRRINWKILSKLEKYAYFNEKVDFSKDDAKEILDLVNSI